MVTSALRQRGVDRHAAGVTEDYRVLHEPTHPTAIAFLNAWRAQTEKNGFVIGRDIPSRSMARFLENIIVYEPVDGGRDMLVRLAGGAVQIRFNRDIKGMRFSELFSEEVFRGHMLRVQTMLATKEPLIHTINVFSHGHPALRLEGVILPVLSPDRAAAWVLGGLFYFG
ncbi:MAG TPA: PAS domain-containing protein [Rhizomicrobium sp.]|nr:PAS domain-containing protein [Rhizomicrobium sp.]